MKATRLLTRVFTVLLLGALGSCSAIGRSSTGETVTLLTHDSFVISDEARAAFEKQSGLTLQITSPGDTGMVLNQLILNKANPTADAVFGVDTLSAGRVIDEGIIENYIPENDPDAALRIDGLTAVDRGDVCVNVDTAYFEKRNLALPDSFKDLTNPEYEGLLVVTNPVLSSPGFAFLAATAVEMENWQEYWQALLDNETKVVDSWSTAFYTDFSISDGDYPLVLSYASSPAAGGGAFDIIEGTCIRQVEYAGVVAGAPNPEGARMLIDFMVGEEFQSEIPETMFMYPVADVPLPQEWVAYAQQPDDSIVLDPALVATHRQTWQDEWTRLFEAHN
ncbi:thiamine transport system substrate-binding protein [Trueperella bonasi]|uniref:Thiamine transport system substrate-binding protein n=1 Tax=Trueperella bonasi TaxID=312286 RepID=A0ABT9NGI2_9ACTO|nr:thiamine ABC transporter substrate-binding protein [Trueperella bonasi]MDP9806514.1 thiamine transport system substrate-binding protein [Trueperella bonasi]